MNELAKTSYTEVLHIIKAARESAFSKVNEELILMYRDIGKYISEKSKDAKYGEKICRRACGFLCKGIPRIKGLYTTRTVSYAIVLQTL